MILRVLTVVLMKFLVDDLSLSVETRSLCPLLALPVTNLLLARLLSLPQLTSLPGYLLVTSASYP